MDVARHLHDEILVRLDEPMQSHLRDEVAQVATHHATAKFPSRRADETTPLVLKAGHATVDVGVCVDLSALDRKLHAEELEALREDQATPTTEIVREEAIRMWKTVSMLLQALAGVVTGMLLGNVSEDQSSEIIAANSLSNSVWSPVATMLLGGLGIAVDTMCAQAFGAKQYTQLWLFAQAGVLAAAYCAPFVVFAMLNSTSILVFLGQDPALASLASFFMRISVLSLPFLISLAMMTCTLVAQGVVVPLTVATFASYAVSVPLAYVLGYKTVLGYMGMPIADFVNVLVQNAILGYVLWKNPVFIESWPGWQLHEAHGLVTKLWLLGVSSILMVVCQNLGFSIVSLLSGLLPDAAISVSSSSISFSLISLALVPLMGFFTGGAVRVGNALGAGRPRRAKIATLITLISMLSITLVALVVCATLANSFAHASTTDAATANAATHLIYVMLPMVPITACVLTTQAVLRACTKQLLAAQLNFLATIVVGVPLGCLLGFQFSEGAGGLWTGQTLGLVLTSVMGGVFLLRLDWNQAVHAARLNAHLHVERAVVEPSPEPRVGVNEPSHGAERLVI